MSSVLMDGIPGRRHPIAIEVELAYERSRRERAEAAERRLQQIVAFKNTLLQDAYHRVANTVQATAGLLTLQARATTTAQVRDALEEAGRRLHLIGRVNELLYSKAAADGKVDIAPLLHDVAACVEQSFVQLAGCVVLKVQVDSVNFLADDAVAMILLANEALTNAYKHAFPSGVVGQIALSLRASADAVVLEVSDTGIGISRSPRQGSLGLNLVRNFATQMGGTLVFAKTGGQGTTVRLTIATSCLLREASSELPS
jgi:two-component sensor histidine kinase